MERYLTGGFRGSKELGEHFYISVGSTEYFIVNNRMKKRNIYRSLKECWYFSEK